MLHFNYHKLVHHLIYLCTCKRHGSSNFDDINTNWCSCCCRSFSCLYQDTSNVFTPVHFYVKYAVVRFIRKVKLKVQLYLAMPIRQVKGTGMATLILRLGRRWRRVVCFTLRSRHPRGKTLYPQNRGLDGKHPASIPPYTFMVCPVWIVPYTFSGQW